MSNSIPHGRHLPGRNPHILVLLTLLFSAASRTSLALPPKTDLYSMSFAELLNVPVSTGSKNELELWRSPLTMSIINREQIRRYGYRTIFAALQSVPGFFGQSDGYKAMVGLRGMYQTGTFNSRILWLVDGHRINDSYFQWAFPNQMMGVPMSSIARIEVVRGPASSIYGSNAFLGVVNVITRHQVSDAEVRVTARIGGSLATPKDFSKGTQAHPLADKALTLDAWKTFENRLRVGLTIDGFNNQGWDMYLPHFTSNNLPQTTHQRNGRKGGALALHLDWDDWRLIARYSDARFGTPLASFGATPDSPDNRARFTHYYAELSHDSSWGSNWDGLTRVYFDRTRFQQTWRYSGFNRLDTQRVPTNWYGAEQRFHFRNKSTTAVMGVQFERHFAQQTEDFPSESVFNLGRFNYSNAAVFGENQLRFGDDWAWTLGARVENNDLYGSIGSFRTALIKRFDRRRVFKLLYGRAFKNILLHDYYYRSSVLNQVQYKILKLSRERVDTVEFRYIHAFDSIQIEASVFRNDISDPVVYKPATDSYFNGSGQRVIGSELSATWHLENGFSGYASTTISSLKDNVTGKEPIDVPSEMFKLGLSWERSWFGGTILSAEVRRIGEAKYQNFASRPGVNLRQDAYILANLILTSNTDQDALTWSFGLYNLTNASVQYAVAKGTRQGAPEQGLNYQAVISYRF